MWNPTWNYSVSILWINSHSFSHKPAKVNTVKTRMKPIAGLFYAGFHRKVNPLPQLCCWTALFFRVQKNGDASIAFLHPHSNSCIQFCLTSAGYILYVLSLSFLFSTWIAVSYRVRRNSRASENRLDVSFRKVFWSWGRKGWRFLLTAHTAKSSTSKSS